MDSPPKTMKAWIGTRLGAPRHALKLHTSWPVPPPLTGTNLLIKVSHAGLNPADAGLMAVLPTILPFRRTPVPGLDFAGTVVQSGPDAPAEYAEPGTKVCGALSVYLVATGHGSLAEYISVPAAVVALVPDSLGLDQAAGLGIVGQTATLALNETGGLKKGDRVLVNGASGGLGAMVVQIAKGHGAYVVGICSGGNAEFVKGLGADETIDYQAHDPLHVYLAEKHADAAFDYVVDCVGHQILYNKSPAYLKPQGKYISLVGGKSHGVLPFLTNNLWPKFLGGVPRTYKILGLGPSGDLMRQVVKYCEEGKIKKVPIDSVYNMEEVPDAYDRVISKRSKGKVIIKVSP